MYGHWNTAWATPDPGQRTHVLWAASACFLPSLLSAFVFYRARPQENTRPQSARESALARPTSSSSRCRNRGAREDTPANKIPGPERKKEGETQGSCSFQRQQRRQLPGLRKLADCPSQDSGARSAPGGSGHTSSLQNPRLRHLRAAQEPQITDRDKSTQHPGRPAGRPACCPQRPLDIKQQPGFDVGSSRGIGFPHVGSERRPQNTLRGVAAAIASRLSWPISRLLVSSRGQRTRRFQFIGEPKPALPATGLAEDPHSQRELGRALPGTRAPGTALSSPSPGRATGPMGRAGEDLASLRPAHLLLGLGQGVGQGPAVLHPPQRVPPYRRGLPAGLPGK